VPSTARSQKGHGITTIAQLQRPRVTVGVDTHLDVHVAHAKDALGRRLATVSSPTTPAGYRDLLAWARGLGEVDAWVWRAPAATAPPWPASSATTARSCSRSTGCDRQARRRRGKSDPVDAEAAARAVQAGEVTAVPKTSSGYVEMLRSLRVARATAVKARTQAINALKALVVTAPADLREQLRGRSAAMLVREAGGGGAAAGSAG